jgi:predicted phage baseplate assembly protein
MSLPIPKLDDKTFNEFFEEARALIPRFAPEWTDYNFSDPGITLIDLFAWLTEMQIYRLDRVTDKNFLKFLRLLGTAPQAAKPAKVDVSFTLTNPAMGLVDLPAGTKVAAVEGGTGKKFIFETDEELKVMPVQLKSVFTRDGTHWIDNTESNEKDSVFYFAFGESARQGNQLYLGFESQPAFAGNTIKLTVNVYDVGLPEPGAAPGDERPQISPPAELKWEYWSSSGWRQLPVIDDTAAFSSTGRVQFQQPGDLALTRKKDVEQNILPAGAGLLYWIRVRIQIAGHEIPPRLDTILFNTISAIHGETFENEVFSGNGLPFQSIELRHPPILKDTLTLEVQESDAEWQRWTEVADFDASGPEDRHYTVNLGEGMIRFGDGIHGRIPPQKENSIRAVRYRSGGGAVGNLQANAINKLEPLIAGVMVINRKAAMGGKDAETLNEAKNRTRRELKKRFRTVTSKDFENLALSTPGIRVARAKVMPLYHPRYPTVPIPGAVTVVVVPHILPGESGRLPNPSDGFLTTVYNHIYFKRIATTDLHLIRPEFVAVAVKAAITISPRMSPEIVRQDVEKALQAFLDPLTGGVNKTGWPFGRKVLKSEIYQVIGNVNGVVCVDSLTLSSDSCIPDDENIRIPRIALAYSGKHSITVGGNG